MDLNVQQYHQPVKNHQKPSDNRAQEHGADCVVPRAAKCETERRSGWHRRDASMLGKGLTSIWTMFEADHRSEAEQLRQPKSVVLVGTKFSP